MKTEKRNLGVGLATLLGAAILTGVAFAGNPHGPPPGQAKIQAKGSASASSSTAAGVKSSAVTNLSGHNTNAPASSNRTKLYGNGKTAGQIAMQNGAGASANLYGPGNSQPHKTVCPGGKATFDVHALKAHGGASACAASTGSSGSTGTSTSTSGSVSTSTGTSGQVAGATASTSGAKAGNSGTGSGNNSSSGVLGATHGPSGSVNGAAQPAKPVFGAANFTG